MADLLKKHDFSFRVTKPFSDNSPIVFDIPRGIGEYIQYFIVSLRDSIVVAGGTTNGAALGDENPGNLIKRFRILAQPKGEILNLLSRSVVRRSFIDFGYPILGTALTGAAGTFTLDQDYYLMFSLPRQPRAIDSALQTDIFTSIQLICETGDKTALFSGNDRTFTDTGINIEVADQREIMPGGRVALLFQSDITDPVQGANPQRLIPGLPVGQRYLDLLCVAETTNDALSDAILNRLTVKSGSVQFFDARARSIKGNQRRLFTQSNLVTADTGLYYVPLSPDFTLGGAVDARFLAQLAIVADEANPGTDQLKISSRRVLYAADQ